jgi:glycosyltransferase involved in cell wall biosynthesis
MTHSQTLVIVFHDMRLGGIQRKILDIIKYFHQHCPKTKIVLCLRHRRGIFLNQIPKNIKIISPTFYTHHFNMIWFTLWLIGQFQILKPTHILSFMDLGSVPTIIALKFLPWFKPHLTIGEDILTSKYIFTESFPQLRKLLIKCLYPHANHILVQTPIQKKDLEKIIYNSHPSSKIVATPNWLPLDFPPKIIPIKKSIDILFVGRIDAQKNIPLFLRIVNLVKNKYPNLVVKIVGDGDDRIKILKLVKKLSLQSNVEIVKSTLDTSKYYSHSKIFLLSSNYEGFPLTLMEAISSGCFPVIRNIPELSQFFNKSKEKFIYNHEIEASNLILKLLKHSSANYLKPYQNKLIKNQVYHLSAYIKFFSQP